MQNSKCVFPFAHTHSFRMNRFIEMSKKKERKKEETKKKEETNEETNKFAITHLSNVCE